MAKTFHEHLDICKQCRDHPHNLCPAGTVILQMELSSPQKKRVDPPREEVELIASGYEWTCPNCGTLNTEIEVTPFVTCGGHPTTWRGIVETGCGNIYDVGDYFHANG